ncbi:MAG: glutathione S-transferase family protein [Alphaproteobacteria bacterium]
MPNLRLIYFKMRALAEAAQLVLAATKTPYSYEMAWDYYGQPWSEAKGRPPFRQLPMLVVDNETEIAQSGAIVRYLAGLTGLQPEDPAQRGDVDAVFEASQEWFAPLNPTINFAVGDDFAAKREAQLPMLHLRLGDFERQLGRFEGPFFFGDSPYYCDFGVFHHVDLAHFFDGDLLSDYPKLRTFMSAVRGLDGVSTYLAERPELIGVGSKPQLVIDGRPEPTGTAKA